MALADTRTGAVLRGSTKLEGSQEKVDWDWNSELEGGAVLRKKKKDCVPEGLWTGDMISPMGHNSKTN